MIPMNNEKVRRNTKLKKTLSHAVSVLLGLAMVAVPVQSVSAEDSEADTGRQTIRVAFPTQEGMSFFGHSGKVTGYNYDYLERYQSTPAGRWSMSRTAVWTVTKPSGLQ